MKALLKKIRIDFFLLLLIVLAVFLAYKNYTPATILSGWDTLHPEFNLKQYLQRISSVWQEHQGLGAPPSQAHAAELPRMIIYTIFSLLFPLSFVRYSYIFLMMILGPIGVYLFLIYLLKERTHPLTTQISAFLGGVFYLLNLGTMQHFAVPLEMFVTKFGFLGFIYLFATKFLDHGHKKHIILFLITIFFSASMAHTATLWYVFYLGLILYCGTLGLLKRNIGTIKRGFLLVLLTFAVNAYWILPHLYYALNYGNDVITSKIHRLFTEEAYYFNKKYGNVGDYLLLRNFLFDWRITNNEGKTELLFSPWIQHLMNLPILLLGYLFSFLSMMGIVLALKRRNKILLGLAPVMILSSFFLLSDTAILSRLFDALRNSSSFVKEALRFPFTKFSLYVIFSLSLFFGYCNSVILERLYHWFRKNYVFFSSLYFYFLFFFLIVYSLPAFEGNFINRVVRVKIPSEYFSMYEWSQKQDNNGRILTLPSNGLFGWTYYLWNPSEQPQIYQGAGFTWFGLKQPSLNREFDRWYPYNEQAYREFWYAVNSNNLSLFARLLSKYQIRYIILDENVILPGDKNQQKKLQYPELKKLLNSSQNIKLSNRFGNLISIYEYTPNADNRPIQILNDYGVVGPSFRWNYIDQAYLDSGSYITFPDIELNNLDLVYPARNILNERERINKNIFEVNESSYSIRLDDTNFSNGVTNIPEIRNLESEFYADIFAYNKSNKAVIELNYLLPYPQGSNPFRQTIDVPISTRLFSINDTIYTLPQSLNDQPIYIGQTPLYTRTENVINFYNTNTTKDLSIQIPNLSPRICSNVKDNQIFGAEKIDDGFRLYGQNAEICLDIALNDMVRITNNASLNLTFDYSIDPEASGSVCVFDAQKNRCIASARLKQFIFRQESRQMLFPVGKNTIKNLTLKVTLNAISQNKMKTLSINNTQVRSDDKSSSFTFIPQFTALNLKTDASILTGDFPQNQIRFDVTKLETEPKDCGFEKAKRIEKKIVGIGEEKSLEYQSQDGNICEIMFLPQLSQDVGYIVAIESQSVSGLPLRVCLENDQTKICALDEELSKNQNFDTDYFIIPPFYSNLYGYNLILTNRSIGTLLTINRIKNIRIIPFPYRFFQAVKWESRNLKVPEVSLAQAIHQGRYSPTFYYLSDIDSLSHSPVIYLNQAYEKNWKAYLGVPAMITQTPGVRYLSPLFGRELKEHVLVNNWANGWKIDPINEPASSQVVIVFLPQYLEFLGFGLLIAGLLWIVVFYRPPLHVDRPKTD